MPLGLAKGPPAGRPEHALRLRALVGLRPRLRGAGPRAVRGPSRGSGAEHTQHMAHAHMTHVQTMSTIYRIS